MKNCEKVTIIHENEVVYVVAVFVYDNNQQKKQHTLTLIIIAPNLKEKLVKNQNDKQEVQSASFDAQEKTKNLTLKNTPTSHAWQERKKATVRRNLQNEKSHRH